MKRKPYTYWLLLLFFSFSLQVVIAQGTGGSILNIDFGEGKDNPGPPLPVGKTSFWYSKDSCASPSGSYTITNNLYRCPATRMGRSLDNTPRSNYGYMMLVNDTISYENRILFIDTLKELLCPGTMYEFSAFYLNTSIPGYCSSGYVHPPALTLKVETIAGQILQAVSTGPMPYDYSPDAVPKFHFFAADFAFPSGVGSLVLKIEDESSGFSRCGYSFAIDDIQFRALGPKSEIVFDGAIGTELVKAVCYQQNKTISMTGSVDNYYANTVYQWQQSTDNGHSWTDIPNETSLNYSATFSVPDTFLFRLSAGDVATAANPNCRVVSNVLEVQVEGIPRDFTISNNAPVCAGSPLQFNATGGASYEWSGPNGFHDNVSYASIHDTKLSDSGMYYLDVYSWGGCKARDSIYVKIIGTSNVYAWPDTAICKGGSVRLMTTKGVNYEWSPAEGLSNTSVMSPIAKPTSATVYTVRVTDSSGCSDTAQVRINVLNTVEVKAGITGSGFLCFPYDSASFRDISTGYIVSRNWDFGNGHTDTIATPAQQYYFISGNQDSYQIKLVVKDSAGCADTAYHLVKVESNCYIAVPSAFTPNGDGKNDYLYPLNAYKATNLVFRVYNREGQLVFETKEWTKKWNGKLGGLEQPTGVYVWTLEYKDAANKNVFLKGTTVLIR